MGRSSVQKFLKGMDRYAKNVSLSYKKKGSFETSIGGCCTIFSFTWLFYWAIVNMIDTFTPPGKFSDSTSIKLIQTEDGYPVTEVPTQRLFTAYKLISSTLSADENIDDYMIGLWF